MVIAHLVGGGADIVPALAARCHTLHPVGGQIRGGDIGGAGGAAAPPHF